MPRPKKVQPVVEQPVEPNVEELVVEDSSIEESISEQVDIDGNPPTQYLQPYYIRSVSKVMDDDDDDVGINEVAASLHLNDDTLVENSSDQTELASTKFAVYSNGEYVETVDDQSIELLKYLDLNRAELDNRIEELWQTPNDPNDLIFFNFGEQKMNYNSYYAYFNVNGFAPVEPRINSWMEYYLNKHSPITEEEIAIQLKGSLQYSFIPIKS